MERQTCQLALDASIGRDAVEAHAARSGWLPTQRFDAGPSHGFELQWRSADGALECAYAENQIVGCAWLWLRASAAVLERAVAEVRAALPCMDLDEVLQRIRRADDRHEQASLAGKLAVLAPEDYDSPVMHALADLLEAPAAEVRMQALLATATVGWPLLQPLVTAVAATDESPEVRQRAGEVLQAFDAVRRRRGGP
jgi:hypothetical protein